MEITCLACLLYLHWVSLVSSGAVSADLHTLLLVPSGSNGDLEHRLQEQMPSRYHHQTIDQVFHLLPHGAGSHPVRSISKFESNHHNNRSHATRNSASQHKRYLDSIAGDLIKRRESESRNYMRQSRGTPLSRHSSTKNWHKHNTHQISKDLIKKAHRQERSVDSTNPYLYNWGSPGLPETFMHGQTSSSPLYSINNLPGDYIDNQAGDNVFEGTVSSGNNRGLFWSASDVNDGFNRNYDMQDVPIGASWYRTGQDLSDKLQQSPVVEQGIKNEKRYLDYIAGEIFKKDYPSILMGIDNGGKNKRFIHLIASPLVKQNIPYFSNDPLIHTSNTRHPESLGTSFAEEKDQVKTLGFHPVRDDNFQENPASVTAKKRHYLDIVGSSLIKRNVDNIVGKQYLSKGENIIAYKRYLDTIGSSLIKRHSNLGTFKMAASYNPYLATIRSALNNKHAETGNYQSEKQSLYLAGRPLHQQDHMYNSKLGNHLDIKTSVAQLMDKRYLDSVGSSLIKRKRDLAGWGSRFEREDVFKEFPGTKLLHTVESSLVPEFDLPRTVDTFTHKHHPENRFRTITDSQKRYLDGVASSLIKKYDGEKRYLDGIASSLIKKDDGEKRYLDGIASSLIKKDDGEKRYLDGIASSLIKKDDGEKRYLDGIASSLIKKDDGEKRYLDGIASSLIKKDDGKKRYLDGIASSLIKKDDGEKRYLDGIASSLIKKEDGEKRYLDGIASSLIKKYDGEKRYLDGIASSLIKKDYGEKRYLDGIASSLIKKDDGEKRYLDGIASSLIKKDDGEKRYLDGIASSLIKKDDGHKRYLGGIASSLIKKDDGEKRYLDGIASSLIKKDDGEKRYLDGIASSLIKKDDGEKRYLDGIASSLIKKDDGEKRYLDGIASSLIKKDDGNKRYLDGIASSLIKKDDGEKRYLDGIASSLIKKDDGEKRYLDGIASSLINKDDGEKRYLNGIASSLIKKDDGEKRYLDDIASSLIKKDDGEKRYLDGIASSLIKKDDGEKRYLDGIASSLIKKNDDEKRYLDGIANSLIKKSDAEKRYLDDVASSLIKKNGNSRSHLYSLMDPPVNRHKIKSYIASNGSSLFTKGNNRKHIETAADSFIRKNYSNNRYFHNITSSLLGKSDTKTLHTNSFENNINENSKGKRYLDGIGNPLIKKDKQNTRFPTADEVSLMKSHIITQETHPRDTKEFVSHRLGEVGSKRTLKRTSEVTDDVMDGSMKLKKRVFAG